MPTAYEKFEQQYRERTRRSREIYEDACKYLPGGVAGNAGFMRPYPLYMKEAKGAYLVDVDGNTYVDLLVSAGPNILGHSPPAVMKAVKKQLDRGTSLIAPTELVVELAKKIVEHMPGMEMVRFANSGSEAVHMALRAARAHTGREKIGRFEGNFHGQYDNALISGTQIAGPEDSPQATPQGAGIPQSQLGDTVVLPFNNAEAAVTAIKQHAHELAAVILEPIACTWMGGVVAETPFLEAVRRVTEEEGVVLIYDEVVTGFRLSLDGAVSLSGVVPDMRAMGKVAGGGFPIGVFGGRREIMDDVVTPTVGLSDRQGRQKMYQSGTFSGNPVSMTAGLAMIKELEKPGVYERLNSYGDRLRDGIRQRAGASGIPVQLMGAGSIFGVLFSDRPVKNIRDVARCDTEMGRTFSLGMVANGVYAPLHIWFTNAALTDADIERVLEVSGQVLSEIKASS